MDWIAAIIRLCDEVDNINFRTLPDWLTNPNDKQTWRNYINSISFDIIGHCIKLHTNDFSKSNEKWLNKSKEITHRQRALNGIKLIEGVLEGWKRPLLEIGLIYDKVFISSAGPTPTLYNSLDENDFILEPALNEKLLVRIVDSMITLNNSVIGKKSFTWESLAAESRIHSIDLIKLAVQRIKFNKSKNEISKIQEFQIISSYNGWQLKSNEVVVHDLEPQDKPINEYIIKTNIKELDYLLCPGDPKDPANKKWQGGFYIPKNESNHKWFTPIVIIEGSSGDGKTSLMNQIACNLVRQGWLSVFYSLEQENDRFIQNIKGYGFYNKIKNVQAETLDISDDIKERIINLEEKPWYSLKLEKNTENGFLIFPNLTSNLEINDSCACSFNELNLSLEFFTKENKKSKIIYFIDSISSFSNKPLSRNQIHQLFSLFRSYEIPLVISLERQKHWAESKELSHYNMARYLADIEIKLESGSETNDYFRQTIEIVKTRYNRRVLGKHQFKLKSPSSFSSTDIDNRVGIAIYPSIHSYLSREQKIKESKEIKALIPNDELPICYEKNSEFIYDSNSCFVVSGPLGSHKLALAMNVLLNHHPDETSTKRKLIISMAEEQKDMLQNIALHKNLEPFWRSKLHQLLKTDNQNIKTKIWIESYGEINGDKKTEYVTLINFRMGEMLSEEFLYVIDNYIENNISSIDSIMFNNTAHIKNRFPSLASDRLFMPTLVDIFKSKGLYSVFVDVQEDEKYDQALLAAADCRINLKHNREQIVINVSNVKGKVYDQKPRYLSVLDQDKEHTNTLDINNPNSQINSNK